ncbi:hypothetical protein ACPUD2_05595 [Leuconostoc mesenteroides subsp. dextranicum]|uniref:hypothetical protein n=1 Tax=Leuconostoc TaxID=1243 RepID=UPI003C34DA11
MWQALQKLFERVTFVTKKVTFNGHKVTFNVAKALRFVATFATFIFTTNEELLQNTTWNIPSDKIRTNKKRPDGSRRFRRSPKTYAAIYIIILT